MSSLTPTTPSKRSYVGRQQQGEEILKSLSAYREEQREKDKEEKEEKERLEERRAKREERQDMIQLEMIKALQAITQNFQTPSKKRRID